MDKKLTSKEILNMYVRGLISINDNEFILERNSRYLQAKLDQDEDTISAEEKEEILATISLSTLLQAGRKKV